MIVETDVVLIVETDVVLFEISLLIEEKEKQGQTLLAEKLQHIKTSLEENKNFLLEIFENVLSFEREGGKVSRLQMVKFVRYTFRCGLSEALIFADLILSMFPGYFPLSEDGYSWKVSSVLKERVSYLRGKFSVDDFINSLKENWKE